MDNESWRQVASVPGLEVSNLGRVRTLARTVQCARSGKRISQRRPGKILSPAITKSGYLEVSVKDDNGRKKYRVHRLVGEAFCEGHEANLSIDHINGNKADNRPENLEWVTLGENTRRQWQAGLVDLRGENQPGHKLTQSQVRAIRQLIKNGCVCHALAEAVGVSAALIYKIRDGALWRHLSDG